jgi:pilus assembly protein CpaE
VTRALSVGIVIADPSFRETVTTAIRAAGAEVLFAIGGAPQETRTLRAARPDVLVLDFGQPSAHAVMEELNSTDHPPGVIAAHTSGDPEIILGALRAGAREFLYPPLNQQRLEHALEAVAAERLKQQARQEAGKTVGFLSAGGNCGATMLACHVAAELRRLTEGGGVLIADLDLGAGTAGFSMRATSSYSAVDAAANLPRLDRSYWNGIVTTVQPRLDVLAAPAEIPTGLLPEPRRFADVIRFARGLYPWSVVDLGNGFSPLLQAVMPELESLYIVTTADVTSLYQMQRIMRAVLNLGGAQDLVKLAIGRVRKDQPLSAADIERLLGATAEAVLPEDISEVAEAHSDGRLISPKCELGRRMLALAARLTGQPPLEPTRPSKFSLFRFRTQEAV